MQGLSPIKRAVRYQKGDMFAGFARAALRVWQGPAFRSPNIGMFALGRPESSVAAATIFVSTSLAASVSQLSVIGRLDI